jgi:hypothetical protein
MLPLKRTTAEKPPTYLAGKVALYLIPFLLADTAWTADDPGERYMRMAAQPGISHLHKTAYEQLAKMHAMQFWGGIEFPSVTIEIGNWDRHWESSTNPMGVLYRMGLDALPALVEALDDPTPTLTVIAPKEGATSPKGKGHVWKVNELVLALICHIADRTFTVGEGTRKARLWAIGNYPDLVPHAKQVVLQWYAENRNKTPAQRKLDDLIGEDWQNRKAAIEWGGEHKEKAGQKAVLDRVVVSNLKCNSSPAVSPANDRC